MTHCTISLKDDDKIYTIYCHLDGHPERSGMILLENYTDINKIRQLIKLGSLNYVGENLRPIPMYKSRSLLEYLLGRKPKEYGLTFDPKTCTDIETFQPHSRRTPWKDTTVASEESNSEFFECAKESENENVIECLEEFNYLFNDGIWYFKKELEAEWIILQEYFAREVFGFNKK